MVWVHNSHTVRTCHLSPVTEIDSRFEHRAEITDEFSSFAPQFQIRQCLGGFWIKVVNMCAELCAYYCPLNVRLPNTKATHGMTPPWGNHVTEDQLEQVHLNSPSLENADRKSCVQDPSLISVCLCIRHFRQRTLLRSSSSIFCQQKTPSHSQFSRISLRLLFSTRPNGLQTISFQRLSQSSKFITCTWSVTKERQAWVCALVSSSRAIKIASFPSKCSQQQNNRARDSPCKSSP